MRDRKEADAMEAGKSPDQKIRWLSDKCHLLPTPGKALAVACINRERKFYPEVGVSF